MKNIIYLSFFILGTFVVKGQIFNSELTCLDFTKGSFRNTDDNNRLLITTIIRDGSKQLDLVDGKEIYKKITWMNDCNYILHFTKKEAKKNSFAKFINENGGITVKTEKIVGNTLYYRMYYFDGQKNVSSTGSMIKIGDDTF